MKYMFLFLAAVLTVASALSASAQDAVLRFQIQEDLPEGALYWLVSFKDPSSGENLEMRIKDGEWSPSIRVAEWSPRFLVGACTIEDCGAMTMMGEMVEMANPGHPDEYLLSNIVIGTMSVPFEVKVAWKILPLTPSNSE